MAARVTRTLVGKLIATGQGALSNPRERIKLCQNTDDGLPRTKACNKRRWYICYSLLDTEPLFSEGLLK